MPPASCRFFAYSQYFLWARVSVSIYVQVGVKIKEAQQLVDVRVRVWIINISLWLQLPCLLLLTSVFTEMQGTMPVTFFSSCLSCGVTHSLASESEYKVLKLTPNISPRLQKKFHSSINIVIQR